MAKFSTMHRSCINLSSMEPCVNRVVSHLDVLKKQVEKRINQLLKAEQKCGILPSESLTPKCVTDISGDGSKYAISECKLLVEGVTTGISTSKLKPKNDDIGKSNGDAVINGALKLVFRLEQDRQETIDNLTQERVRVETLGKSLDKECERRLNLLPSAIQSEHNELLQDIIELRWHVSFDRRQLNRVQDDLKLTRLKNDKLKRAVGYFVDNCPLLDEKLILENAHMSDIVKEQQETFDKLNQTKHRLSQTEDKSSRAQKRASRERTDMQTKLDECCKSLYTLELKLKETDAETASLTHQIKDCQAKILENKKEASSLGNEMLTTKGCLSQIESRVSLLQGSYSSMEKEHQSLMQKLERLKKKKQTEHDTLEAEQLLLMAEMQKENQKLREARDSNEDLQHSIDTLKENIALFNKQTQDDEKSVERARRELINLDEQMGVSMAQFTKIREEHVELSDQLKIDEAKAEGIEHSLRTKLGALKQQVKVEGRTKIMYDSKVQASSAELDKIKAKSKQQTDKAEKLAAQSHKQCQGQVDVVATLQEKRDSMTILLESLMSQLCGVQSEHATVEGKLSEKISTLTLQEKHLSKEMQSKISQVEAVTERLNVLRKDIEDRVRSAAMLDKMEVSTNASIDQLESQLRMLREKLIMEREEEQRCKDEYEEIAGFSTEANEKHTTYLQRRLELLKQCKVDLFEAHSLNVALAKDYKRLQYEFISAKSLALQVLEKKLEMEESLRDQRQLLAFQSCIFTAMKAYYDHRGTQGLKDVSHFGKESRHNAQCLKLLQTQFRTVIKLMDNFLEQKLPKIHA